VARVALAGIGFPGCARLAHAVNASSNVLHKQHTRTECTTELLWRPANPWLRGCDASTVRAALASPTTPVLTFRWHSITTTSAFLTCPQGFVTFAAPHLFVPYMFHPLGGPFGGARRH